MAQGALDGLCGLYAAINAIQVVVAPERLLRRAGVRHLFEAGIRHLARREQLDASLVEGMDLQGQYRLTKVLTKEAARYTGLRLCVTRPVMPKGRIGRDDILSVLDEGLGARAAVITCLWNSYNHYTAIVGRSDSRYYLHDSAGLQWIKRANVGSCSPRAAYTHQIERTGIALVRRV
jgi:hypothetical protein